MLKSEVYQSVEGRNLLHIDLDDVSLYLEEKDFVKVQGTRVQQALGKLTDAPSIIVLWQFTLIYILARSSLVDTDHFWQSIFDKGDACGDAFQVLPKLVKCALSLSHSNADVERSLSVNKRVLTKEKTAMNTETLIGIRHVKAAIAIHGDVTKVPVTHLS